MKKSIRISVIVLGIFCIGGLGSLFVNYIVYSKLVTNPVLSDNSIIKALFSKVVVTEHTKEVVVKDNESLSVISAKVSAGVVYIENLKSPTESFLGENGNGIVMSSDGIIAIHESVLDDANEYKVGFYDGLTYEAEKVFKDEFSGVVFLRVKEKSDLTVMPFANSADAISGRKLINIYREKISDQAFFTLGILSGYDYLFQTKQPSCDYLEGTFRVDFNEKALEYGLGGPVIDFNGEMVGMLAKNYKNEYFMVASNDIKAAFDRFLEEGDQIDADGDDVGDEESRIKLGVSCNSLSEIKGGELSGVRVNYSVDSVGVKNSSQNLAQELGINDWDIITYVGDHKVGPKKPLSKVLMNYKKGDLVKIKLLRDNKEMEVDVNF